MKILHQDKSGKWTIAFVKNYANEAELQDLLANDINILPLDEIGYEEPFVTIGKEVGLHGNSLDLMAISPSGQIAVVETKLGKNPEVKREVVGQLLSYAGSLWNKQYEDLERYFAKYLLGTENPFKGSLVKYVQEKCPVDGFLETNFKQKTTERLMSGAFTLLIVVDSANPELRDIANYLNDRTGAGIDFYVIEVERVEAQGNILLVPRLVNPPRKSVTTRVAGSKAGDPYDRTPISKESFLGMLDSPADRKLADKLLHAFEHHALIKMVWRKTGFSIQVPIPEAKDYPVNYSFFLFHRGHDGQSAGARLGMGYPEDAWRLVPAIHPKTKDYRDFYTAIKGYRGGRIGDLTVFDDKVTKMFVDKIGTTAKKITEHK
ncbi:MAG: hypothetical protein ACREF5_00040 [Candidatus Saccharimonadales bacterium]